MKNSKNRFLPGFLSIAFLLIAVALFIFNLLQFETDDVRFPAGSTVNEMDISGLSVDQAFEVVKSTIMQPVTLSYVDESIRVSPVNLGLVWDDQTLMQLLQGQVNKNYTFWNSLWNIPPAPVNISLEPVIESSRLETFLRDEIATSYDQSSDPVVPVGTTRFAGGGQTTKLDILESARVIKLALEETGEQRNTELVVKTENTQVVSAEILEVALKLRLRDAGFNGMAEIFIKDLGSGQTIHFADWNGEKYPGDIAFSAASTIKIPILISVLRRVAEPIPDEVNSAIERMMILSENPPADQLMEIVIGSTLAPLEVTEDMRKLGLENTFLSGYFYLGAPLLQLVETPANTRNDIQLNPDVYNQTSASEMGRILEALYQCAASNQGLLIETFPGEITQSKCQYLLDVMSRNKIGVLSEAGVPEGTKIAHKHGWTEESDGYLHTVSDVGVVYTPGSDFVLVIFLYDSNQLLFNPANALIAQLTQTVYNAFNLENQIEWNFGPIEYR